MSDAGKLVKNTTVYAIGDIIPKIFSFITFPILTKTLPLDDYGILNYINSIDVFIVAAGLLCLNTYYLVYYYKVGEEDAKRKLLGNLTIFIIVNYLVIATLLFLFGPQLFKLIGSSVDFYPYIALGIATAFFTILTILPSALFRVKENPLPLTTLNVVRGLVIMVFTILSVYVFEPNAKNVLWARFISTVLFGLVFLYITYKNATFNINIPQLKHALAFSIPLVPAALATYLYSMFDKILIEKYLSLEELGLYSTASTLAFLLNIVSHGAYKAFEPHFFKTYGSSGFDSSFEKVRDILLFVVIVGGLFICGFSNEFLHVFSGENYWTARFYVPILTIGAIASAMNLMYATIVTAREKTKLSAAITIIGAIVSIGLEVLLLRYWGIWAASFISAFAFIFLCYANMLFSKVKVGHLKPLVGILIAIISMYLMTFVVQFDNLVLSIALKIIIIVLSSLILMWLLKVRLLSIIRSLK